MTIQTFIFPNTHNSYNCRLCILFFFPYILQLINDPKNSEGKTTMSATGLNNLKCLINIKVCGQWSSF